LNLVEKTTRFSLWVNRKFFLQVVFQNFGRLKGNRGLQPAEDVILNSW